MGDLRDQDLRLVQRNLLHVGRRRSAADEDKRDRHPERSEGSQIRRWSHLEILRFAQDDAARHLTYFNISFAVGASFPFGSSSRYFCRLVFASALLPMRT